MKYRLNYIEPETNRLKIDTMFFQSLDDAYDMLWKYKKQNVPYANVMYVTAIEEYNPPNEQK